MFTNAAIARREVQKNMLQFDSSWKDIVPLGQHGWLSKVSLGMSNLCDCTANVILLFDTLDGRLRKLIDTVHRRSARLSGVE